MNRYYLKFRYIAEIFLIASFMGWIYESVWYSMVENSYLQEALTGSFSWDYSSFFLNYEGRIALKPDIMFGLLSLYGMKQVVPAIEILRDKYGESKLHNLIFVLIFGLFIIDVVISMSTGRTAQ